LFELELCGTDLKPLSIPWREFAHLSRARAQLPLICSIFNWSEVVEWEGVRLIDVLDFAGIESDPEGYFAFYSNDGVYFETLATSMAHDPWTLLATGLNGQPLPQGPRRPTAPSRSLPPGLQERQVAQVHTRL